ncbi:hypothetical protein FMM75_15605 [Lachnospiraceae bacterium MD335]|nr:hypothetical protein [Lachnospiraceae bacterium MD335]
MSSKNYYNAENNPLYILHFPGHGLKDFMHIIDDNIDREIVVGDDISIISTMNQHCWEGSPVREQCEKNHIPIYNTALEEVEWSNPLKIKHAMICLNKVATKYALILDGRDVVLVRDMADEFIEKFKKFGKPILYNGTPVAFPKEPVEPLAELFQIRGKQKFLNAGVCFGEVEALKTFYARCAEISAKLPDNKSEQLIVRMARQEMKDLVAIDHNNELFRICHPYDTVIKEYDEKLVLI